MKTRQSDSTPAYRRSCRGVAALLTASMLAGCGDRPPDPEAALRQTLEKAEAAAEAGDADALVALIARDYSDLAGRDRRSLSLTIRGLLMRYRQLELVVSVDEMELFSPVLGRVEVRVFAAGAGSGTLSADGFRLEASLRDDGDGWRVVSANWGGRGGI
jgi:hypothetical protein